jgi:hypothetical protein
VTRVASAATLCVVLDLLFARENRIIPFLLFAELYAGMSTSRDECG